MPPKKGKGQPAALEQPANPVLLARPATPNDFNIVATVKALQEFVNVEAKWKNRLAVANHAEATVTNKLKRLDTLVEQCQKGIAQVDAEVDVAIDEYFNMVSLDPQQIAQWHAASLSSGYATSAMSVVPPQALHSAPGAGQGGAAAGKAGGGTNGAAGATSGNASGNSAAAKTVAVVDPLAGFGPPANAAQILSQWPPAVLERRKQQKAALRNIVLAYYKLPRLQREERRLPRPTSPVEMQREFDEVARLSTPPAEAAAIMASRLGAMTSPNGKPPTGAGNGSLQKSQSTVKGGLGEKKKSMIGGRSAPPLVRGAAPATDEETVHAAVEELGFDLHPGDVLALPLPRGIDSRLMQKVLMLRSRRLRLDASMALFLKEQQPLKERLRCVAEMRGVGHYSLAAVQPQIALTMEQEMALQKIRQVEDDMFRRTAQTPPPTRPGARGRNDPATTSANNVL